MPLLWLPDLDPQGLPLFRERWPRVTGLASYPLGCVFLADTRYFIYTAHLGSVRFPSLEPSASTPSSVFSCYTEFDQLCPCDKVPLSTLDYRRTGFNGNNRDPYWGHHISLRLCNLSLTLLGLLIVTFCQLTAISLFS
jgi:hypothetical protein